jgi:hypothetical protein
MRYASFLQLRRGDLSLFIETDRSYGAKESLLVLWLQTGRSYGAFFKSEFLEEVPDENKFPFLAQGFCILSVYNF